MLHPPQAIVSCNQLVRQLVPLIVDATLATLDDGAPGELRQRQAAVQALLRRRLATNAAAALGLHPFEQQRPHPGLWPQPHSACSLAATAAAAAADGQLPAEAVEDSLLRRHVPPGGTLRLSWNSEQAAGAGWRGLLLLVMAAPPCSGLSVAVRQADDEGSSGGSGGQELAEVAAALPPLLPALQQRWVPRHWQEVMRGIDWQQNATRMVYVPFVSAVRPSGKRQPSVEVVVQGSAGGGSLLLAQALAASPAEAPALQLQPPGRQAALPAGHAAALRLQLPQRAWPPGADACRPAGGQRTGSPACLLQLLVGGTPPWSLRIQQQRCADGGGAALTPAVLAVQAGGAGSDSVRLAGDDSSWGGPGGAVRLWDGVASLDQLWLVSDPSCPLALR